MRRFSRHQILLIMSHFLLAVIGVISGWSAACYTYIDIGCNDIDERDVSYYALLALEHESKCGDIIVDRSAISGAVSVAKLMSEVRGIDCVGLHDAIFDLSAKDAAESFIKTDARFKQFRFRHRLTNTESVQRDKSILHEDDEMCAVAISRPGFSRNRKCAALIYFTSPFPGAGGFGLLILSRTSVESHRWGVVAKRTLSIE